MKRLFVVALALIATLFFVACVSNDAHQEVLDELASVQGELANVQGELAQVQSEFDEYKAETADWVTFTEEQRQAETEIARRTEEIAELDGRIQSLQGEIGTAEEQLASLQGSIIRARGESRSFPAGVLSVGTDIEPGRYRIYGGSSNFFVRRGGRSVVNIILGGRHGVSEYVFTLQSGDEIEARSSFRLQPIE